MIRTEVLYEEYDGADLLEIVEGIIRSEYRLDIHKYPSRIVMLDSITLNDDRHFNNISFYRDGDKLCPMPVFDNGSGLLSCIKGNDISSVRSKPFCSDFFEQVALFKDCQPLMIDYKGFLDKLRFCGVPDGFSSNYYRKAIGVLIARLKETWGYFLGTGVVVGRCYTDGVYNEWKSSL